MTLQEYQIDKRVKESFGDYQVSPPASVWNRLEHSIGSRKRQKVILYRRRFLAAAAVILAFFTGYLAAVLYAPQQDLQIPGRGMQQLANEQQPPQLPEGLSAQAQPAAQQMTDGNVPSGRNSLLQAHREKEANILPPMHQLLTLLSLPDMRSGYTEDVTLPLIEYPYLITKLSPMHPVTVPLNTLPDISRNNYSGRFAVAGLAGQTYANYYLANTAKAYDNGQFAELYQHDVVASSKELVTRPSVSYGMTMDFGITRRIGVSTGLAMHRFSAPLTYGTGEIALLSTQKPVYNQFGVVHFNDHIRSDMSKSPLLEVNTGEFIQRFSYVEVPVTGVYSLIDRKVNLGVRAGLGGNILTGNSVVLVTSEETTEMGTTEGMRPFYLSGIAGLDVSMQFRKHWSASFSPVYRHALQGVSHQETPRPHIVSLGFYSGIRYRF
jgi:hypothetical protein